MFGTSDVNGVRDDGVIFLHFVNLIGWRHELANTFSPFDQTKSRIQKPELFILRLVVFIDMNNFQVSRFKYPEKETNFKMR